MTHPPDVGYVDATLRDLAPFPWGTAVGTDDLAVAAAALSEVGARVEEGQLDLYDRNWPIWTFTQITPPAKFVHDKEGRRGQAVSTLVSGGCSISGATVRGSLLFTAVKLKSYSRVENAVILPDVEIERSAFLTDVIIDRGVRIPAGLVVGQDPELDAILTMLEPTSTETTT